MLQGALHGGASEGERPGQKQGQRGQPGSGGAVTAVQYESFLFSQSWRVKSEVAFGPDSACLMADVEIAMDWFWGWRGGGPHQTQWFTVRTKAPFYLTDKPALRTPVCSTPLESQLHA